MSDGAKSRPWQPLLVGDARSAALDVVHEIAAALSRRDEPRDLERWERQTAECALLFGYLHAHFPDAGHDDSCHALLEQATEQVEQAIHRPGLLAGGVAGLGWIIRHLSDRGIAIEADALLAQIDGLLLAFVESHPQCDYDLIEGYAGFALFALESPERAGAQRLLSAIVERLDERCDRDEVGAKISTVDVPGSNRESAPILHYDLGVAHGMAGLIAALGAVVRARPHDPAARRLLKELVDWLLRQELESSHLSCFPAALIPGRERKPARIAWCYGDPGVALALSAAARALEDRALQQHATRIALDSADHGFGDERIVDASLCHGASGMAQICARFFQATGDERFRQASLRWLQRVLDMRRPGDGVAGFTFLRMLDDRLQMIRSDGLLGGGVGVALTLLGAVSQLDPGWDRLLLMSST